MAVAQVLAPKRARRNSQGSKPNQSRTGSRNPSSNGRRNQSQANREILNTSSNTKMPPGYFLAFRKAIDIQRDHPEIADLYRAGKSYSMIVRKLGLRKKYQVTKVIACSACQIAIAGTKCGDFEVPGLIPKETERLKLAEIHNRENGERLHKKGKGIFNMSAEEVKKVRKKLDRLAAVMMQKRHGYKPWVRRRKVGQRIVPSEVQYAYRLSQQIRYQHKDGSTKGDPLWAKITEALNDRYHRGAKIRTATAVKNKVYKYKRKLDIRAGRARAKVETIPWKLGRRLGRRMIPSEVRYAYWASRKAENQLDSGPKKGKANWAKVARVVNKRYHRGRAVRSKNATQLKVLRYMHALDQRRSAA